jgi:asparagine N-glycosylation enzyme membrane subunit Stt3
VTASVTGSPDAITFSNAIGGTFTASNYAITYANGTFTVNPAPLTANADNLTKVFGGRPRCSPQLLRLLSATNRS